MGMKLRDAAPGHNIKTPDPFVFTLAHGDEINETAGSLSLCLRADLHNPESNQLFQYVHRFSI